MAFEKEAAVEKLREIEAKQAALSHASGLLYCDGVTVAPEDSVEGRARTMGVLSEKHSACWTSWRSMPMSWMNRQSAK